MPFFFLFEDYETSAELLAHAFCWDWTTLDYKRRKSCADDGSHARCFEPVLAAKARRPAVVVVRMLPSARARACAIAPREEAGGLWGGDPEGLALEGGRCFFSSCLIFLFLYHLSLSLSLSHTRTHTLSLFFSLSLSLSFSIPLSLSLSLFDVPAPPARRLAPPPRRSTSATGTSRVCALSSSVRARTRSRGGGSRSTSSSTTTVYRRVVVVAR